MNCDFSVLWVDDDEGWYKLAYGRLVNQIKRYAMELESVYCRGDKRDLLGKLPNESGDQTDQEVQYDLILMDYQLGQQEHNGSELIESIRERDIFTDVLFYSTNRQGMIEKALSGDKPLDGVYFADRKMEEFEPRLESVVKKIIRRSENIISLRGLVLENTTTFEETFKVIMADCWSLLGASSEGRLNETILQALKHNITKTNKSIAKWTRSTEGLFVNANESPALGTYQRVSIIFDELVPMLEEQYELSLNTPAHVTSDLYKKQINQVRNQLGHVKEGNTIRIDGEVVRIDSAFFARMRENIRSFDAQLKELTDFIDMKKNDMEAQTAPLD